jgi:hypothetical protein
LNEELAHTVGYKRNRSIVAANHCVIQFVLLRIEATYLFTNVTDLLVDIMSLFVKGVI